MSKKRTRYSPRQAAVAIIEKLTAAGHQALLAGGCVRDMLRGANPKDYDIACSATPEDIIALYPRAQLVGAHFGVVIVREGGQQIEVATFRTDGHYSDGRHPDSVSFATATEDAQRRDFTINGMFFDIHANHVIDYVGGQQDLSDELIQAIGNPEARFEEDHLRMLRAVRFAARLGFTIEQDTFEAIYNRADKIRSISSERVLEELHSMMAHPHRAAAFQMLADTNLLMHLWPNGDWSTARIARSSQALAALPDDAHFAVALAAMLIDHDVARADRICVHLKASNDIRRQCTWLLRTLPLAACEDIKTVADLKLVMIDTGFGDLLDLLRAWLVVEGRPADCADRLAARAASIPPDEIAPVPLLGGDDLIALNVRKGPIYKRVLEAVYYRQLNGEVQDRDHAVTLARDLLRESGAL